MRPDTSWSRRERTSRRVGSWRLYQVVLPDPQGYVLMQGMVASTRATTMVPEFRAAAQTFRRTAR